MTYYVYIIQSIKDYGYYIGVSSNPEQRLKYHNLGTNLSTKTRIPFRLIHQEKYENNKEALRREKQLKSYKGGNAFRKLIAGL